MNTGVLRCFALMIVAVLLLSVRGEAQISTGSLGQDILRPSAASYYYIAKPSELSMQVNIWGFVRNPGRYEIPTTTNLIQLLSYAGGPIEDGVVDHVKITRAVGTSLSGGTPAEIIVNLEDLKNVNPQDLILYPNDTVFIDHSTWGNVQDVFQVITVLAIVTGAVAQVIIAVDRSNN